MASILLHLPEGMPLSDPNPEMTGARSVELVDTWDESVIGVVGWSTAGLAASWTAAQRADLPRLAIVASPFPDDPDDTAHFDDVASKTLLLFGSADPMTGSRHGRAWQKRLPDARLEMVPGGDHDLLFPMWGRILSHVAPGRKR